ncbi:hypothetical protein CesoFtcFv8_013647 [Champsocephalus esox]|uniref:Uncharacterized protein n=1 Tax=Champsocephalus esox TaxID=159716 RepID=A0AAN8BRD7_9TELE|nr:hypothetical protein CesoFtcFv8_013647 [Champsocephalus esox]
MQDHIVSLSGKLDGVQQQYEEERLQRLVQEEAVKFLWKQLQSMQQWKQSVEQQLSSISQAVTPAHISAPGLCVPPVASSTAIAPSTGASFPDSGFQSTSDQLAAQEDSFLSSGSAVSLKTVRALSSVCSGGVDSADCSLLEQYLSSVQQMEEEAEEGISDRTETPQPSSPAPPSKTAQSPPPGGCRQQISTAGVVSPADRTGITPPPLPVLRLSNIQLTVTIRQFASISR